MIIDRPSGLLTQKFYAGPPPNIRPELSSLPDLLKLDMVRLSGIQPITGKLMDAAGGHMRDNPCEAEIDIHRTNGSRFQLIQVVISVYAARETEDGPRARPYAVTLVPAMKRGAVQTVDIEFLRQLDLEQSPFDGMAYLNFDPFLMDRDLWGQLALLADMGALKRAFTDEIGLVSDGYFLMQPYDADDVLMSGPGMGNQDADARYRKHQLRTYFKPFTDGRPRRVWGAESPIELFIAQKLLEHDLWPDLQTLMLRDGATFPTLYELMSDPDFSANPDIVTSTDFYFREQRLAVFYDSTRHHRSKAQQERDTRVTSELEKMGIRVIRLGAKEVGADLDAAVERVVAAL